MPIETESPGHRAHLFARCKVALAGIGHAHLGAQTKPADAASHGPERRTMANRRLLTTQEVVELVAEETGTKLSPATFRSYASRGQAPAPIERRANVPFYSRKQILEWARNRPGSGARTDLRKGRSRGAARTSTPEGRSPSSSTRPQPQDTNAVSRIEQQGAAPRRRETQQAGQQASQTQQPPETSP